MIEFLLSSFYFLIFCFIISKISFFEDKTIPRSWFIAAFAIKFFVAVILTLIYTKYYTDRSTADVFKYFDDGLVLFSALENNPIDYLKLLLGLDFDTTYFTSKYYEKTNFWNRTYEDGLVSDTHIIIRFNAFVRLFSFGYFQVHNVFINFVSLVGLTLIYKAFKSFLVQKEKLLFYVILLIPSVLFWGSGLLKESIIFFGLGLFLHNFFKLTNNFKPLHLIYCFVGLFLIVYTKLYLVIAFSIPVLGHLINHYLKPKKIIYSYLTATTFFLGIINFTPLILPQFNFVEKIASKQQTFSRFVKSIETNSGIKIPELTDGLSIIKNIPNALNNTLIRPYLWECKSVFVWLSAIENIAILLLIIMAIYYQKKITNLQQNIFLFNLFFIVFLFTIIGLTTPVFGAIMRYKIPGLILLMINLLIVLDIDKIRALHPTLKKIL